MHNTCASVSSFFLIYDCSLHALWTGHFSQGMLVQHFSGFMFSVAMHYWHCICAEVTLLVYCLFWFVPLFKMSIIFMKMKALHNCPLQWLFLECSSSQSGSQAGWLIWSCIGNSWPVMCVSILNANLHLLLAGLEHVSYMYIYWWHLNAGNEHIMLSLPCKRLLHICMVGKAYAWPKHVFMYARCTPILHTLPYLSKLHFESKMSGWTHSKHLQTHSWCIHTISRV